MSGETERQVSGWTVDTLHVHIDQKFNDLRRQLDERFLSTERAISKAEVAADKRFESINEFRAQLNDQQQTFLTRSEYGSRHEALGEKIDQVAARLNDLELRVTSRLEATAGGQATTYRIIGWGFAVVTILMTVIIFAANYLTK